MKEIWVFNGTDARFPFGIFEKRADAEEWIAKNGLTGVLTKYPVGVSVYEWATANGHFRARNKKEESAAFIQTFSSAAQAHIHFDGGSAQ